MQFAASNKNGRCYRCYIYLIDFPIQQNQTIGLFLFTSANDEFDQFIAKMSNAQKSVEERLEEHNTIMNIIKTHFNSSKEQQLREYRRKFKWLNDVTTVKYEKKVDDEMKLCQIRCCFCNSQIPNQLMILVHFELAHPDLSLSYSIDERCLVIKRLEKPTDPRLAHYTPVTSVSGDFAHRVQTLLSRLLGKLTKGQQKETKMKFYHTERIFEEKKDEQNEDSSEECEDLMGDIRQIERERIEDFVDINKNEKELFILWNTHARGARVMYGGNHMFKHQQLIQQLKAFLKDPKVKPLRTSFLVHLNVLWSYGRITSNDILQIIHQFDKYHDI